MQFFDRFLLHNLHIRRKSSIFALQKVVISTISANMDKILNRTKQEWMEAIKKSIQQKQEAVAAAKAQLQQERIATA